MKINFKIKVGEIEFTGNEILHSDLALGVAINQLELRLQDPSLFAWEREIFQKKIKTLKKIREKLETLSNPYTKKLVEEFEEEENEKRE